MKTDLKTYAPEDGLGAAISSLVSLGLFITIVLGKCLFIMSGTTLERFRRLFTSPLTLDDALNIQLSTNSTLGGDDTSDIQKDSRKYIFIRLGCLLLSFIEAFIWLALGSIRLWDEPSSFKLPSSIAFFTPFVAFAAWACAILISFFPWNAHPPVYLILECGISLVGGAVDFTNYLEESFSTTLLLSSYLRFSVQIFIPILILGTAFCVPFNIPDGRPTAINKVSGFYSGKSHSS